MKRRERSCYGKQKYIPADAAVEICNLKKNKI